MALENKPWQLESFVDSLIMELDRAQDTLAIKGVNRPFTYTVKDLALELQLFPQFDGNTVRFQTAKAGESGASKVKLELGSVSAGQIKEITKNPITKDDVTIEAIEEIDDETKRTLQKIGVNSGKDLERMEKKNIDIGKAGKNKVDYSRLANLINQARRKSLAPAVNQVSVTKSADGFLLTLNGNNLALSEAQEQFPVAMLNDQPVNVVSATGRQLTLAVPPNRLQEPSNRLTVALDPYSVIHLQIKS